MAFYKSLRWQRTREAFLQSRHYVCERCGRPAVIAHHKRYITAANVHDATVALSHDNLEALCRDCHNKEHHSTKPIEHEPCEPGLSFDSNGDLVTLPSGG